VKKKWTERAETGNRKTRKGDGKLGTVEVTEEGGKTGRVKIYSNKVLKAGGEGYSQRR